MEMMVNWLRWGSFEERKRSSDDVTPSPALFWHRPEDLPLSTVLLFITIEMD
jgi:hypothetical protein